MVPLLAGLLGLAGALAATSYLHRSSRAALDHVLEERLRGAGETASQLMSDFEPSEGKLRAIMEANGLEGAYVLSTSMEIQADAAGPSEARLDLLRVDASRARLALSGQASIDVAYSLGELKVATGYFPVRGSDGRIRSVLALEAGQGFVAARRELRQALWVAIALSLVAAFALAVAVMRWSRAEEERRAGATRAAQGEMLARMAAMVAHEIRNPLGVIRGAAELIQARSGEKLDPLDREAITDVMGEVERLRRLTEDFLDLARELPLQRVSLELCGLVAEAVRATQRIHPDVSVTAKVPAILVVADAGRLRQVLANLLLNAAQAGARSITVEGRAMGKSALLTVGDDGPGIDPAVRARLFDPFSTGRADGTGLGLAVSRRIVERHGGELTVVAGSGSGATFQIRLPLAVE